MPGRELEAVGVGRRWRRLRVILLAAVLAALTMLLAAGAANADTWPVSPTGQSQTEA